MTNKAIQKINKEIMKTGKLTLLNKMRGDYWSVKESGKGVRKLERIIAVLNEKLAKTNERLKLFD